MAWSPHPRIYEINTWVWLGELSRQIRPFHHAEERAEAGMGRNCAPSRRCRLVHGRLGTEPCRSGDRAGQSFPDD